MSITLTRVTPSTAKAQTYGPDGVCTVATHPVYSCCGGLAHMETGQTAGCRGAGGRLQLMVDFDLQLAFGAGCSLQVLTPDSTLPTTKQKPFHGGTVLLIFCVGWSSWDGREVL